MRVKSFLIVFITLLITSFLISCESNSESNSSIYKGENNKAYVQPKSKIILAHNAFEDSIISSDAVKLKGILEEKSDGEIGVDIYENLGSLLETQEAVKNNVIQMEIGTVDSNLSPAFSIFDLPNVVPNRKVAREIFIKGTPLRNAFEQEFEKINLKLLVIAPSTFSVMSANKSIKSIGDLKHIKIGVLENDVVQISLQLLGAIPVTMEHSQLYLELQQGIVEAQENPIDVIVATKLNEQQKYIIDTKHFMNYTGVWINLDFYNSLSKEYKKIIDDSMPEIERYSYDMSLAYDELSRIKLKNLGFEFISMPKVDLIKMRNAANGAYDIVRKKSGEELLNIYLKSVLDVAD